MNFIKLTDINGNMVIIETTGLRALSDEYGQSRIYHVNIPDDLAVQESIEDIAKILGI